MTWDSSHVTQLQVSNFPGEVIRCIHIIMWDVWNLLGFGLVWICHTRMNVIITLISNIHLSIIINLIMLATSQCTWCHNYSGYSITYVWKWCFTFHNHGYVKFLISYYSPCQKYQCCSLNLMIHFSLWELKLLDVDIKHRHLQTCDCRLTYVQVNAIIRTIKWDKAIM